NEGKECKAGGRVVKNVAGYDLCKLHVGALGTLGIITQATLKLKPLPAKSALVAIPCPDSMLAKLLDGLHASRTRPVSLSVLDSVTAADLAWETGSDWLVVVGFEDNAQTTDWQVAQVQTETTTTGLQATLLADGQPTTRAWRALADFPLAPSAVVTFKANLLPS